MAYIAACIAALDLLAFKLQIAMLLMDLACLDIRIIGCGVLCGGDGHQRDVGRGGHCTGVGLVECAHCLCVNGSGGVLLHGSGRRVDPH